MKMRALVIILFITIGCGDDTIMRPRADQEVQIRLGSSRREVLNVLGEPEAITVTAGTGTVFVYDNCAVWFDDQIVTNIFCDDIPISKKDISKKIKI